MGLKLDVDIESFRRTLIMDGKKSAVIKSIMENKKDELVRNEIINYLSDDEKMGIILDEDALLEFVNKYNINTRFIDMVCELTPHNDACLEAIIKRHVSFLKTRHFERLLKSNELKDILVENSVGLQDDEFYYLYSKRIISTVPAEKVECIMRHALSDRDLKELNSAEMMNVAHLRTLTSEELQIVLDTAMDSTTDLRRKGIMESLIQTHVLPKDVLNGLVKSWEYDISEGWFKKMLFYQNLDDILDYIMKNHKLEPSQMELIVHNKRTSRRVISCLYEDNTSLVVNSKNPRLPVLDCHIQSL